MTAAQRGDDLRSSPTLSLLRLPPQFVLAKLLPNHTSLTFFLHLDLETLLEPARLALVPPRHVDDALAALLADVVEVPAIKMKIGRSFNHSDVTLSPSNCASPQSDRVEFERKGRRNNQTNRCMVVDQGISSRKKLSKLNTFILNSSTPAYVPHVFVFRLILGERLSDPAPTA